jgi:hypothetical protein
MISAAIIEDMRDKEVLTVSSVGEGLLGLLKDGLGVVGGL